MNKKIYQTIQKLIETDDMPIGEINEDLERIYLFSSLNERLQIDRIFIALCGYSMEKILFNPQKIKY